MSLGIAHHQERVEGLPANPYAPKSMHPLWRTFGLADDAWTASLEAAWGARNAPHMRWTQEAREHPLCGPIFAAREHARRAWEAAGRPLVIG